MRVISSTSDVRNHPRPGHFCQSRETKSLDEPPVVERDVSPQCNRQRIVEHESRLIVRLDNRENIEQHAESGESQRDR
jgi:hypothetical protein